MPRRYQEIAVQLSLPSSCRASCRMPRGLLVIPGLSSCSGVFVFLIFAVRMIRPRHLAAVFESGYAGVHLALSCLHFFLLPHPSRLTQNDVPLLLYRFPQASFSARLCSMRLVRSSCSVPGFHRVSGEANTIFFPLRARCQSGVSFPIMGWFFFKPTMPSASPLLCRFFFLTCPIFFMTVCRNV